ncbi:MAG: sulfatase [Polyangiaceae bacterium]
MHARNVAPLALLLAATACSKTSSPTEENTSVGATGANAATTANAIADASAVVAAKPARGPYNVLFITIDSLRADMPWAGYPRAIAPNLTALAKRSTVYTNAYSISSFTSKSVAGMLSGRFPSELARTGVFFTRYEKSNTFMCETLEQEGIPCVAGEAHAYLAPGYAGLDQGFYAWKLVDGITFDYNKDPFVTSQKLTPLAIHLLEDPALTVSPDGGSHPFFAWFHYMDPHDVYQSHEESPHFGTKLRDLYDEEVFYTDLWIGKLLAFVDSQPWGKNTLIVVSADHGEAFGEHGRFKHAHELYEELIHVPLLVHLPDQTEKDARTIDAMRSQIDLVPTFFDVMGQAPTPNLDGASLKAEWYGGPAGPSKDIVTDLPEDEFNQRRRSLTHDGWKIIAHGNDTGFELYHLADDPKELTDLMLKDKENSKRMRALYKEASAKLVDVAPTGGIPKHDD